MRILHYWRQWWGILQMKEKTLSLGQIVSIQPSCFHLELVHQAFTKHSFNLLAIINPFSEKNIGFFDMKSYLRYCNDMVFIALLRWLTSLIISEKNMHKNLQSPTTLTEFAPLSPEPEDNLGITYFVSKFFKRGGSSNTSGKWSKYCREE